MNSVDVIDKFQKDTVYPLAKKWREAYPVLHRANDARVMWFEGIAKATNNLKLGYLSLVLWQTNGDWKRAADGLSLDILREFETFILWGYVHNLSMITEETMRLLVGALGERETGNIARVHKRVLEFSCQQPFDALFRLLRLLRNMCHHNGFHFPDQGGDEQITWGGRAHEFLVGHGVDFVSVRWLTEVLTKDICTAADNICSSPGVMSFPIIHRRVVVPNVTVESIFS